VENEVQAVRSGSLAQDGLPGLVGFLAVEPQQLKQPGIVKILKMEAFL